MPFSKLPGQRVVFHLKDVDSWISDNKITEYHRFVHDKLTIDDLIPESYKPPTDDEMFNDYVRELHEKWITKNCKKSGMDEVEYAKLLKDKFSTLSTRAPDKNRIKWTWDFKKRKYVLQQGVDSYKKYLKKDDGFQGVLTEMSVLMQYLSACYK